MALLILFALIAGAATAITPCVLPVLPALLSASATGGRRRPLGIVLGLTVTFTITIVALATVIDGVGLADGATRTFAILVLLGFGVVLLVPAVAPGSRRRSRGLRASARRAAARGSSPASSWAVRSGSCTRRVRDRSSRRWCR